MDQRQELRDFLISRRGRITPEQAGMPAYGGTRRRVPGLRRSELAMLAGVSVEYLTKLERGNASGVSDSVLDAVGQALQLDAAETAHLFDLARGARTAAGTRRRPTQQRVRPGVQQLLDSMTGVPAFVQNGRLDVLAANSLARALYSDLFEDLGGDAARLPNHARYTFLDPRAGDFYPDWNRAAADGVALLRAEAGRNPHDRELNELIGELATRSSRFSALWATHNVRWHTTGIKHYRHRVVGELALAYEGLALPADSGQTLITFTAAPGSAAHEALSFLASWVASAPVPWSALRRESPGSSQERT
jgi:transcriptional regulator with XRE-family HTH domain